MCPMCMAAAAAQMAAGATFAGGLIAILVKLRNKIRANGISGRNQRRNNHE